MSRDILILFMCKQILLVILQGLRRKLGKEVRNALILKPSSLSVQTEGSVLPWQAEQKEKTDSSYCAVFQISKLSVSPISQWPVLDNISRKV